jgi:two-component system, LytTR family, sensor histidine kinase AlgZ
MIRFLQTWLLRIDVVSLVAWVLFATLVTIALVFRCNIPVTLASLAAIPGSIVLCVLCRSSRYIAKVQPLSRAQFLQSATTLGAASLVSGSLFGGVILAICALFDQADPVIAELALLITSGAGLYLLMAAFYYVAISKEDVRLAYVQALEAQMLAKEATLAAMNAKINPHFLFNCLNAIAALAPRDPVATQKMCVDLASFLRWRLHASDARLVPLGEELDATRAYLDIERVRFSDRLIVQETIDEDCLQVLAPPHVIQPLIENAIKHGIAQLENGGTIALRVGKDRDRIAIEVTNDLAAQEREATPKSGKGLPILRQRLNAMYGQDASLSVVTHDTVFKANLRLPITHPEKI